MPHFNENFKMNRRNIIAAPLALALAFAGYSCQDNEEIGGTIVDDAVTIVIDSTFTITGNSIENNVLPARTATQLLGRIDARGYGFLESDFVSQFMPANKLVTDGVTVEDIDSIKLRMFMISGDYVGDTLTPMGLTVFRLKKQLPGDISSDYDPLSAGVYDPSEPMAEAVYTASVVGLPDSVADEYESSLSAMRIVDVRLPDEFGRELFTKFTSPGGNALFNDPQAFAEWFPGLYVKNTYGTGRVMEFSATRIYLYYTKHDKIEDRDTTYNYISSLLAVTPEVINNNNINQRLSSDITTLAAGSPIAVAPTGYDSQVQIPIRDILDRYYRQSGINQSGSYNVVNSMTFSLAASEISNTYGINPPEYMLLIRKDKRADFFKDKSLNDNRTSFYAAYNSTTGTYDFTAMRQYLLDMIEKDRTTEGDDKGPVTDAEGEFVLTPVSLVTETYQSTTTVVAITPCVEAPAMVKFNLPESKIKVTYSKQSINN